jgi:hypothetical protein
MAESQESSSSPAASQGPSHMPYRRNYFIALGLSIVVGMLGVDRFYMGKIGTGILKLITGGGLGIWWIIDMVLIASGQMRDKQGQPMTRRFDLPD